MGENNKNPLFKKIQFTPIYSHTIVVPILKVIALWLKSVFAGSANMVAMMNISSIPVSMATASKRRSMLSTRSSERRTSHAVKSFVPSFIVQMNPIHIKSSSQWPGRIGDQQCWEALSSPGWMLMQVVQRQWFRLQLPQQHRQWNWFCRVDMSLICDTFWTDCLLQMHALLCTLGLEIIFIDSSIYLYISLHSYLHAYILACLYDNIFRGRQPGPRICSANMWNLCWPNAPKYEGWWQTCKRTSQIALRPKSF